MNFPKVNEKISNDMCLDDLISVGNTVVEEEILERECENFFK